MQIVQIYVQYHNFILSATFPSSSTSSLANMCKALFAFNLFIMLLDFGRFGCRLSLNLLDELFHCLLESNVRLHAWNRLWAVPNTQILPYSGMSENNRLHQSDAVIGDLVAQHSCREGSHDRHSYERHGTKSIHHHGATGRVGINHHFLSGFNCCQETKAANER